MKYLLTILSFIIFSPILLGQSIKVKGFNDEYERYRNSHHFDYIHPDFDTSKLTWVADLRVEFDTVLKGMIGESYKELKEKANRFGANSFSVEESDIYSFGKTKFIDLKVYWLRMEDRGDNMALHRSNDVYLFGFLGYHQEIEGYEVEIQEEDFTMRALTYRHYSYPVKTDVTVQLGSKIRGAKTSFKMHERMYPKFLYFNMVKGSFKNAYIDEYSLSFGVFLTRILEADN